MTNENGVYLPVKLCIGHSGWVQNYDMNGLATDVIMQNICWICREKALSVEEIARTLGIAAVYLEDKIDKLLYMDYLKKVGSNKVQTTFFVCDFDFAVQTAKIQLDTLKNVAGLIFDYFDYLKPKLEKARELLAFDGVFSDNTLTAALLMPELSRINLYVYRAVCKKNNISCVVPKRKDGSEHWVAADTLFYDKIAESKTLTEEQKRYMQYGTGPVKTRETEKLQSMQYDLPLFDGWRDFENVDLRRMERVHEIAVKGETPNSYDKEAIAGLVAKGYVRVDDGRPVILVPYLRKQNITDGAAGKALEKYFAKVDEYLDMHTLVKEYTGQIREMSRFIPGYLDKNEQNHLLGGFASFGSTQIMYLLFEKGYLSMPDKDEQKRICTYIWEK